jgi:hypothetical protein
VTTHDTHSEHSDVEASVVEHSPVVEMPTSSSETTEPVQETVDTSLMKEQQTEPVIQAEQVQESPSQVEETPPADTQNQAEAPAVEAVSAAFADTQETVSEMPGSEVSSELAEVSSTPSPAHEISLVDAFVAEEEVRPFTDFIEEFRQAEARFNSSLQAYQEETSPTLEDVAAETAYPQEEPLASAPAVETEAEPESQVTGESAEQKTADAPTSERPVSPLLRPATRLRLPRHGGGRHREEVVTDKPAVPEAPPEEAEVKAEPTAPEPPRPARRYRFDRPAAATSNGVSASSPAVNVSPASQAQSRTEESKDVPARGTALNYARPENGHSSNGQAVEKETQAQPQAKPGNTRHLSRIYPRTRLLRAVREMPRLQRARHPNMSAANAMVKIANAAKSRQARLLLRQQSQMKLLLLYRNPQHLRWKRPARRICHHWNMQNCRKPIHAVAAVVIQMATQSLLPRQRLRCQVRQVRQRRRQ